MPIRTILTLSTLVFATACCKQTVPDEAAAPTTAPAAEDEAEMAEDAAPLEQEEEAAVPATGINALEGIEWELVEWNEGDPVDAIRTTLLVNAGQFVGNAACNNYFVPVSDGEEDGDISVGEGGLTKMLCDPAANEAEQRYIKQLAETTRFDVVDGNLVLTSPEGRLLFQRVEE